VKTLKMQTVSLVAQSRAFARVVDLVERVGDRRLNLLRVLTYHRVDRFDAHPELDPGLISATPEAFEQQMRYLATNYHVISAPELLELERTRQVLPPRSLLLTFDDAYSDFAEHAWPILQRYRLPVTLFVPTAFPDQQARAFWWDRLYDALRQTARQDDLQLPFGKLRMATMAGRMRAFRQLKEFMKSLPHHEAMEQIEQLCCELDAAPPISSVLGWDALRQLARAGVTLGAHTQTHPLMNRISREEVRDEVVGSLHDLEREIGAALPLFAYPSGGFDDEVIQILKQEGIALAFSTVRGANDLGKADRLRLRRFTVGARTTLALLRAQLLPWRVNSG
jgi:peptidoglycan/xylan/chitin deacetylase (PgdA/CDA1 family)